MSVYLLAVAAVIVICIWLDKISFKIGVPTLLAFILLGMVFGSDGILKIPFNNLIFAEEICSVVLIFIMFYGGFGTSWKEAKSVAKISILMSTFGVFITAGLTAFFCHRILKMPFYESLLFGSLISSTDAASVFSILRSRKLNLKYNTASLLEVESGSNDPSSYMLTVICLSLIKGKVEKGMLLKMLLSQIILGTVFGILTAWLALLVLRNGKIKAEGYDAVFIIAVALFAYGAPDIIGGNGYLSAYIAGIILGNVSGYEKKALVHFFDGLTGLMQIVIFFLLGLVAFPSKLPEVAMDSFLIALFLTFVARPAATFILMTPFKCPLKQQLIVAWSGLRGAASIVFAIMATVSVNTEHDLLHMVFFIVLFSILLQGSLLPILSAKLNMIDETSDVMKTFTDYTEETPVQFIQFHIPENYMFAGKKMKELPIPPDSLVVLIRRNGWNIIPDGDTVIMEGDSMILTGESSPEYIEGICLSEIKLREDSKWCGKYISDIPKRKDSLVILVIRDDESFIPAGDTMLKQGDILVINQLK